MPSKFESGGANPKERDSEISPPLWLMPPVAETGICAVLRHGASNPTRWEYNWRDNPIKLSTYISAAKRHIACLLDGEDLDPESNEHHASHLGANAVIILDALYCGTLIDDRPKVKGKGGQLLRAYKQRWKQDAARMSDESEKINLAEQAKAVIEQISQRCLDAVWHLGVEEEIWERIHNGKYEFGLDEITQHEADNLRRLSAEMGGWVFWDTEDNQPKYICTEEWFELCRRRQSKKTPDE